MHSDGNPLETTIYNRLTYAFTSIRKGTDCMSLSVKTRKVDDVLIVDLSGRLTIGEPVMLLRETLRAHLSEGSRNVILNLGDVSYIDSSGLGELVSAYTTIRNKQGDVKLLKLTAKARDLLQMTKLLTVFDTYDDETMAVAASRK